jgi:YbbR domain-containing protein
VDLRNNLGLKLTAIFLALASWVYVHNQEDITLALQVPVDLTGIPDTLEMVGDHPPDIDVRLRGPELSLGNMSPQRVTLKVNLAALPLRPGINEIPLDATMVGVPSGITVDRLSPSTLELTLEARTNKEVPVLVNLQGEPADGYEVVGTSVVPAHVVVEGPESAINKLESMSTAPIAIANARDTLRPDPRPLPAMAQVRLASPDTQVEVVVRIRPVQGEITLTGVRIVATGVPANVTAEGASPRLRIQPASVTVHAAGPRAQVESLTAADLVVVVDLGGRTGEDIDLAGKDLAVRAADPEALNVQDLTLSVTAPTTISVAWTNEKAS